VAGVPGMRTPEHDRPCVYNRQSSVCAAYAFLLVSSRKTVCTAQTPVIRNRRRSECLNSTTFHNHPTTHAEAMHRSSSSPTRLLVATLLFLFSECTGVAGQACDTITGNDHLPHGLGRRVRSISISIDQLVLLLVCDQQS
jgi:hypothetical protein